MDFVSDGCYDLCGYHRHEIESQAVLWGGFTDPDIIDEVDRKVRQAAATGKPFEVEYRVAQGQTLQDSARLAMTNTLQRIESRGLVKIEADPGDGRGKLVSLCEAGRNMREQCIANIGPLLVELENEIGARKFSAALPLLETIRSYLDEHR